MEQYRLWITENVSNPYRQCKFYSELMCKKFPELRLVRGWYVDTSGTRHPHWWTQLGDTIIDATVAQYALSGVYEEFTGPEPVGKCMECGDLYYDKVFAHFCSTLCHERFMYVLR